MELRQFLNKELEKELIKKIPDSNFSTNPIIEGMKRCEEETIIKVLTQYLHREPTNEDFKKVTRYFYQELGTDNYELTYEKVRLGVISYDFGMSNPLDPQPVFSVNFIPSSSE